MNRHQSTHDDSAAHCQKCGSVLPSGAHPLCLGCLLLAGLPGDTEPGETVGGAVEMETPREAPGTVIGRYKLLEKIGEGGFAVVYLAEQTDPVTRKVALKLLKPGMDSREVVARFEAERQALALMDHPNIARVYDGGTAPSGRPYFVMELVCGLPITEFCDLRRMPLSARLELFRNVCFAVQHAHQKGIIHRDLKPSNILVTVQDDEPVPKVIDFGIAKALQAHLTERTLFTRFNQWLGTPDYMSPEQAGLGGLDVDTRSDIYSLGAILYELLTGSPPFRARDLRAEGYDALLRKIREEDPPKPSTRISSLTAVELSSIAAHRGQSVAKYRNSIRGELDWILLKALERDRSRRYETPTGLASDIARYLSGQPILAVPRSVSYHLRKLVRKHWKAAATVGAFALTLLAGTVVSIRAAHRASLAEGDALKNAGIADANAREARANERLAESALERTLIQQADGHLQAGEMELGLAGLARVLRKNPAQAYAAARLCNLLVEEFSASPVLAATMRHELPVAFAELSPDGMRIVTGAGTKARIWETGSGKAVGGPIELGGEIRHLQLSPDGRLALVAAGSRAAVHAVASGMLVGRVMDHPAPIKTAEFSPDGTRVLTVSADNAARMWDASTGNPAAQPMRCVEDPGASAKIFGAVHSPDGTRLLTWSGAAACLWTADGREPIGAPMRHEGMRQAWFSPDGSLVVTQQSGYMGYSSDGHKLWDARTGSPVAAMGKPDEMVYLVFSPSGKRVATVGAGLIRLWDTESRQAVGPGISTPDGYHLLASYDSPFFSPDGKRLVVGFAKGGIPAAQVHDTEHGEPVGALIPLRTVPLLVKFNPDGQTLISGSGNGLRIREMAAGMPVGEEIAHQVLDPAAVVYDPEGKRLATFYGAEARLWDARTGAATGKPMKTEWRIEFAAFHPDGRILLTGASNGTAHLWDAASGNPLGQPLRHVVQEHGSWSVNRFTARFSPDGQRVLTASQEASDGTAKLWNSRTAELIGAPMKHPRSLTFAGFSPDGSRVVTTTAGSVHIWDGETGRAVGEPVPWEDEEVSVSFSRSGRWVLAAGQQSLRLIDASNGKPAPGALSQLERCQTLRFHPQEDWILANAKDGTAGVWDLTTGRSLGGPIRQTDPAPGGGGDAAVRVLEAAGFSPDGRLVITYFKAPLSAPGSQHPIMLTGLQLWDAQTCLPVGKPTGCYPGPYARIDPAGTRLLTCGGPTESAFLWDIATGERIGRPMPFEGAGMDFARFTPKGDRFLTKFYHTPKLWDSATGKLVGQLGELESSEEPIRLNDLVFSADGERVALCTNRGVEIRGLRDGKQVGKSVSHPKGIDSGEFTPDGQWLVTRSDRLVETWNVRTGERSGSMPHGAAVRSLKLGPGGDMLLTVAGCFTHLWNPTTGEPIGRPLAHPHPVESAWFTRDGTRIVTRSDQTVRVFDVRAPARREVLLLDEIPLDTVDSQGSAELANLIAQLPKRPPPKPGRFRGLATRAVRFSPDGRLLAITGHADSALLNSRDAQVWDAKTRRCIAHQTDSIQTMPTIGSRPKALGPKPAPEWPKIEFRREGGGFVITAGNGKAQLHTAGSGEGAPMELSHDGRIIAVGFSPEGNRVLTVAGGVIQLWDAATGQRLGQPMRDTDRIIQARFSGDGGSIVTCSADGTARVWDTGTRTLTGKPFGDIGGEGRQLCAARFDASGSRYLVISSSPPAELPEQFPPPPLGTPLEPSDDATGRLWEVTTGSPVGQTLRHASGIRFARFSDDGRLLVTTSKDAACIWDAGTGRLVVGPLMPDAKDGSELEFARFSPDGTRLATVAGCSARTWNCASGQPVGQPLVHRQAIRSMDFAADGRRLATASADGVARIWDVDSGLPLTGSLSHGSEIDSVALSPDGAMLAAAPPFGPVTLWDLPCPGVPVPQWFIDLAEALGGRRLSDEGKIEEVSSDEFLAIKKQVLVAPVADRFHALAQWLLGNRHQDAPATVPPWASGPVEPGR